MQQGSLYPALHRLQKKKFLKAEWRTSANGKEAKYYALTGAGQKHLEEETANWIRLSDAVGLILRVAE